MCRAKEYVMSKENVNLRKWNSISLELLNLIRNSEYHNSNDGKTQSTNESPIVSEEDSSYVKPRIDGVLQ